ncbi:MAG: hypothetical protein SAK29_04065 [Scytonema sp. PMC 1069.18]|nr:hypothetical protein [Scytonema sp. PMC 1069.18]MEC4884719.1 hypothetical protein [Scytonema sp. PMC 1070.18]
MRQLQSVARLVPLPLAYEHLRVCQELLTTYRIPEVLRQNCVLEWEAVRFCDLNRTYPLSARLVIQPHIKLEDVAIPQFFIW